MRPSLHATVQQGLLQLLEETPHSHQEVSTEPRPSLLETLARIDAPLASRRYPGLDQTIAGHAEHARYYLQHTIDFLEGRNEERLMSAGVGEFRRWTRPSGPSFVPVSKRPTVGS